MRRAKRIDSAIRLIREQYFQDDKPWFLAFSGGKDSTALFAAVYSALSGAGNATRPVTLLYCDTGVEIPPVRSHAQCALNKIKMHAINNHMPIKAALIRPRLSDRYFVQVAGRGYAPPTNKFRWCTDRLRTGPVRRAIRSLHDRGEATLLLGTRWNESQERRRVLAKYEIGGSRHYFRQLSNARAQIFAPLSELSTKDVWEYLHSDDIPACIDVSELVELYRAGNGSQCLGNCLTCDTCVGRRFGCWTCTVVRKDRAVFNMIQHGHTRLVPMLEFRDWLVQIRDVPRYRYERRRNGAAGPGPFRLWARRAILAKLLEVQDETGWPVLGRGELEEIWSHW